jgi:aminopeptidase N
MFRRLFIALTLLATVTAQAQDIDVLHYRFALTLSDSSDRIEGGALVTLKLLQGNGPISLDLVQQKGNGKGMTVKALSGLGVVGWEQRDDKIVIRLDTVKKWPDERAISIQYSGVPDDGLIISKNKWGDRTFFADNWPNRAHHWIPCNDRPDDKASFEFIVDVPPGYAVISNGGHVPVEEGGPILPPNRRRGTHSAHWVEHVPLSTKVMVIGVAKFATKVFADSPPDIPVTAWVYPQDSAKGFYDYGVTPSILKFFSSYIAPFPYEKLANVQSKTIFGGMENASAIFYAEESVTGDRKWEDVFAHEIAHQWFGDMASEKSFAHLWLSEGFATYMTNIYIGQKYGVEAMRKRLEADRKQVINFVKTSKSAVVDSTSNLMSLLNSNSYQKGGWVLHMLRYEVGDSVFRQIIRTYYNTYKGKNADTDDFQTVAESVFGKPLDWFFSQWLYAPGIPVLYIKEEQTKNKVIISIDQASRPYLFTLEVGLVDTSGKMIIHQVPVTKARTSVTLPKAVKGKVRVVIDPNTNLLYRRQTEPVRYYWMKTNRSTGESRIFRD